MEPRFDFNMAAVGRKSNMAAICMKGKIVLFNMMWIYFDLNGLFGQFTFYLHTYGGHIGFMSYRRHIETKTWFHQYSDWAHP